MDMEYIDAATQIAEVRAEVDSGAYDSTQGLRPVAVWFSARERAIGVTYPAGPDWISWDQLVRYL